MNCQTRKQSPYASHLQFNQSQSETYYILQFPCSTIQTLVNYLLLSFSFNNMKGSPLITLHLKQNPESLTTFTRNVMKIVFDLTNTGHFCSSKERRDGSLQLCVLVAHCKDQNYFHCILIFNDFILPFVDTKL